MSGKYIFQLLLVFIALNNAFVSASNIENQEINEGSGYEDNTEENLKLSENDEKWVKIENFMSNKKIDREYGDSINSRNDSKNDIFNSNFNNSPKLKFVIPTDSYMLSQKLIPRKSRMIEAIEETPIDDSENKRIDDTSFSTDKDSKHPVSTPEYEESLITNEGNSIIEIDEGSGSNDIIVLSTTTTTSITTTGISDNFEETTNETPTFSTPAPNFVQQNSQHVSKIAQGTAQSLVASSETKRLSSSGKGKIFQSKMYNIIFATSILSIVALFAILGLTYMFKSQNQSGTLDIEMQEQYCGKDTSENEDTKDEAEERLLTTPDADGIKTIDNIL